MPSRELNRILWAAAIALTLYFGFKASGTIDAYFARVGRLDVQDVPGEDAVYLRWSGKIDAPMEERIAEVFDQYRSTRRTFVLTLSSPGGSLDHGAKVVRLLQTISATHRIETVVKAGKICGSMCVPVYLQGRRRTAASSAQFMFHEVSFTDSLTGKDDNVPKAAVGRETDRLFDRYFKTEGVSEAWMENIRARIAGGHEVWKTGRELADENAGVVQEVRD